MSNAPITQTDLDALKINERQPRIVRECRTREEAQHALAQEHHVKSIAQLAKARKALTQTICDVLGLTRRQARIPQAHLMLYSPTGVQLARWEQKQWERVLAEVNEKGQADLHLGIAPDIQAGVLAAWEAQR